MNKKLLSLATAAALSLSPLAFADSGTVNVSGTVANSACYLAAGSTTQTLTLSEVNSGAFNALSTPGPIEQGKLPLTFTISGCSSETTATVTFTGGAQTTGDTFLGNANDKVGFQIFNGSSVVSPSIATTVTASAPITKADFVVKYASVDTVAGAVSPSVVLTAVFAYS